MTTAAHKTGINLSEDERERVIELLNARLADSLDLSTQAKHAHWNVKGIDFYKLHLFVFFLEKVGEHADQFVDMIAGRTIERGGTVMATARLAARFSSLPEYNLDAVTCEEHLNALTQSLAKYGKLVRQAIAEANRLGDPRTAELFTEIACRSEEDLEIAQRADQDLYFLEMHLAA
jgi:starvation-inducible DNA-binding protein